MKRRLLLSAVETPRTEPVAAQLTAEGYHVDVAAGGHALLLLAGLHAYDVIILDGTAPAMDAAALVRQLRRKRVASPVLILSACDGVADRVTGLDAGADDYLSMPFSMPELLARLQALLRRRPSAEPTRTAGPLFVSGVLLLLAGFALPAAVIHVDAGATGANDGTSWMNAFTNLQDALATASDEIWVAGGTYRPGAAGERNATFQLRSNCALYGGFAGNESNLAERSLLAHPTVLSGDLLEDDGPDWANASDNSFHVVTATNVDATAVLDGFTISGGNSDHDGAGLFLRSASPTLANCVVSTNLATLGAGMSLVDSAPLITHCVFSDNVAWSGRGGAIYAQATLPVTIVIRASRFLRNEAWASAGPGDAGAIWGSFGCALDIRDSLFEHNEARWRFASGSMAANGGAMVLFGEGSRIDRCVFRQNRAHVGGAIWLAANGTLANSLFAGNEAYRVSSGAYDYGGYAGAIYIAANRTNLIVNCTFHANTARSTGGLWTDAGAGTSIANCILFSNTSTEVQAKPLDDQLSGATRPEYSCIRDLLTPEAGEDPPDPANYPGCTTNAPLFLDEDGPDNVGGNADDDLRLQASSPCVDAASNTLLPAWVTADFAGMPRRFDAPVADTGVGPAPIVDMGAFEFIPPLVAQLQSSGADSVQLSWNSFGAGWDYTVEWTDDPASASWLPIPPTNQWPVAETNVNIDAFELGSSAYFRIRSTLVP